MGVWRLCCDSGLVWAQAAAAAHSYLNAGGSEIGDLELDADGRLALLVFGFHAGKSKVGPHQVLLATLGANAGGSQGAARPQPMC